MHLRRLFVPSSPLGSGVVTFGVFDRQMREPFTSHGLDTNDGTQSDRADSGWDESDERWWDAMMRGVAVLSFADLIHRPEWHVRSACRDLHPDTFFPGTSASEVEAKLVCAGCPVRSECLAHAIERDIRYGVWGGLAARERVSVHDRATVRELVVRRTRIHVRAV